MAERPNLLREIAGLEKRIHILETVNQPIGGISVVPGSVITTGAISLSAGAETNFTIQVTPNVPTITQWDILQTIHVDTDDAAHRFHDGGSLSSSQKKVRLSWHWDYEASNDATGMRKVFINIKNEDSSSHTYYYYAKIYSMNVPFT